MYTVRANAMLLEGSPGRPVPHKLIWNNCVPPKVSAILVGKCGGEITL